MGKLVMYMALGIFIAVSMKVQAANENEQAIILSYIDKYQDIAVDEMVRTGIPASIKLAQGILESNAGRSHLAVNGNNHFGIKCGKYWTGKSVMREDDDYKHGKLIKSCFRAFPTSRLSYKAHSEFLMDPKKHFRYGSLFDLSPTDYKGWAKGLKKAGYATDPKYPNRLISIIERYQLYQYDTPPLAAHHVEIIKEEVSVYEKPVVTESAPSTPKTQVEKEANVQTTVVATTRTETHKPARDDFFTGVSTSYVMHKTNDVKYITTTYGDNLENIALETGVTLKDLVCFNDKAYSAKQVLPTDIKIYVESKKTKYNGSRKTYRMSKGESLFEVAQQFGIQLSKLLKRNNLNENYRPKGGDLIYLKGRKK